MGFGTPLVGFRTRRVELFARRSGFGTRRPQSRTPRAAFLTRRMRSEPVTTTNPNLPPLLGARKLSPARANRRSRDCNPEYRTVRECRYGTGVTSFAYMGGPGREGFGPAGFGVVDRYCRPCRVPAHPHRWVAPHSTRGKTMDQPTQAVPIPRGHRPANCYFTSIAQRPPSGGAR